MFAGGYIFGVAIVTLWHAGCYCSLKDALVEGPVWARALGQAADPWAKLRRSEEMARKRKKGEAKAAVRRGGKGGKKRTSKGAEGLAKR